MTAEFSLPEITSQNQVHGQHYSIQCFAVLMEAAKTFKVGPPTEGELTEVSLPEKFQSNSAQ